MTIYIREVGFNFYAEGEADKTWHEFYLEFVKKILKQINVTDKNQISTFGE